MKLCRRHSADSAIGHVLAGMCEKCHLVSQKHIGRNFADSILPDAKGAPILHMASWRRDIATTMQPAATHMRLVPGLIALLIVVGTTEVGCVNGNREREGASPAPARQVVVVAPVLNLSGTNDFDSLKITDTIASEFLAFSTVSVIPVNLTLATLDRLGKKWVEGPEDALMLARELGADVTVVTVVTEYNPYDPPIIGLIMQWYEVPRSTAGGRFDPVVASREAHGSADVELTGLAEASPRFQLQRVFNAAHNQVLDEVRRFAHRRAGQESPYGWRKYIKSQELYVRYCCWSMIRTILRLTEYERITVTPNEMQP